MTVFGGLKQRCLSRGQRIDHRRRSKKSSAAAVVCERALRWGNLFLVATLRISSPDRRQGVTWVSMCSYLARPLIAALKRGISAVLMPISHMRWRGYGRRCGSAGRMTTMLHSSRAKTALHQDASGVACHLGTKRNGAAGSGREL